MNDNLTPVILLGGTSNALSIARSLGSMGVPVYAVNFPTEHVRYSRFCTLIHIPAQGNEEQAWTDWLLGPASDRFQGAVLLACSDLGLEIVSKHRDALLERFRLDLFSPRAQMNMLDKLSTYRLADQAGVTTPRYWPVQRREQIDAVRDELVYPLLVKPLFSHKYQKKFVKKFVIAQNFEDVAAAFGPIQKAGIEVMLVEMIPGPDDRLCSYYTYLDEQGEPQFHFTKRIIRRYPAVMGGGCYHITDWVPEARDLGVKFFKHVGLRGLGNVEFKLDTRDGKLKIIECNARFTAANGLVADAGFDLARFVYNRLTGRPQKPLVHFESGKRLWYPLDDYRTYREGQVGLWSWLKSVFHRQTFPYFRWNDPLPSLVVEGRGVRDAILRRLGKGWGGTA